VLALTASRPADALRAGVEDAAERGFEELAVHTPTASRPRLLRDEALEGGHPSSGRRPTAWRCCSSASTS
jgi:hypothetical protein